MVGLTLAVLSFVGSHELLSHPLRRPLVARLGERGFAAFYSLVALAAFAWVLLEYRSTADEIWWTAPAWAWTVGAVLMFVASVLFVGSLTAPNPALPMAGGLLTRTPEPMGVLRLTRHPMMWSFAIWAPVHAWLSGKAPTVILAAGIGALALFGAAMQDRKKGALLGEAWAAWRAKTSFVPLARGIRWPGLVAVIGGTILYLAATWVHPRLGAPAVGFWSSL